MREIDARGLNCPQPVIMTKKALEEITEGEVIAVVDNLTAKENVSRLASNLNHEYKVIEKDGLYHIHIKKSTEAEAVGKVEEEIVVVITNDKLGKGDEELGTVLMKGYTYTLTEVKPLPKVLMLINSGVKLACEGSDALVNLQKLDDEGVEIICCGTCLDFYGLKDKLKVGIIGNMYSIVEKMNTAAKVINIG